MANMHTLRTRPKHRDDSEKRPHSPALSSISDFDMDEQEEEIFKAINERYAHNKARKLSGQHSPQQHHHPLEGHHSPGSGSGVCTHTQSALAEVYEARRSASMSLHSAHDRSRRTSLVSQIENHTQALMDSFGASDDQGLLAAALCLDAAVASSSATTTTEERAEGAGDYSQPTAADTATTAATHSAVGGTQASEPLLLSPQTTGSSIRSASSPDFKSKARGQATCPQFLAAPNSAPSTLCVPVPSHHTHHHHGHMRSFASPSSSVHTDTLSVLSMPVGQLGSARGSLSSSSSSSSGRSRSPSPHRQRRHRSTSGARASVPSSLSQHEECHNNGLPTVESAPPDMLDCISSSSSSFKESASRQTSFPLALLRSSSSLVKTGISRTLTFAAEIGGGKHGSEPDSAGSYDMRALYVLSDSSSVSPPYVSYPVDAKPLSVSYFATILIGEFSATCRLTRRPLLCFCLLVL